MKAMPYASNQGVRIHYQVEGKGPPVMLLHGLSETHETWHIAAREYQPFTIKSKSDLEKP